MLSEADEVWSQHLYNFLKQYSAFPFFFFQFAWTTNSLINAIILSVMIYWSLRSQDSNIALASSRLGSLVCLSWYPACIAKSSILRRGIWNHQSELRSLKLWLILRVGCLEGEEQQKRHHQTKKSHGFGKGETQNGVGEQLLLQWWITRVTDDQRTENATDTGTGSSDSDSRGSCSDVFSGGVDVHGTGAGLEAPYYAGGDAGTRQRRRKPLIWNDGRGGGDRRSSSHRLNPGRQLTG